VLHATAAGLWDLGGLLSSPTPQRAGHHIVPQKVVEALLSILDPDAIKVFANTIIDPELYNHGPDTWNGVTHPEYSKLVKELLQAYRDSVNKGGKLDKLQAERFIKILIGDAELPTALAQFAERLKRIRLYLNGLRESIFLAVGLKSANSTLTKQEVKEAVKLILESKGKGPPKVNLGTRVGTTVDEWLKLGTAARKSHIANGLKLLRRAGPVVAFLLAAWSVKKGIAQEGPLAESGRFNGQPVYTRVQLQVGYDLFMAEDVEAYIYPVVEGLADSVGGLFGLPATVKGPPNPAELPEKLLNIWEIGKMISDFFVSDDWYDRKPDKVD
jgi:hypothetical protein